MRHCKLSRSLSCSLSVQFGIAQAPSSKRHFPTNRQVATYCTTEWEAHVSCRSDVVNHSHNATDIYSLQCEAWVPGTRWYIDIDTLVGPIFPARIFRVSTSNWKEECSHSCGCTQLWRGLQFHRLLYISRFRDFHRRGIPHLILSAARIKYVIWKWWCFRERCPISRGQQLESDCTFFYQVVIVILPFILPF